MIAGFVVFWPAGLVVLGWKLNWFGFGEWFDGKFGTSRMTPEGQGFAFGCKRRGGPREPRDGLGRDSGNSAFDGWKQAEIARLQAEFDALAERQREFEDFLLHLREAKDREEFERFMQRRSAQGEQRATPQLGAGA
jgi:hypothetical protein